MARVIGERESGTEVVTGDEAETDARMERAIRADGIHIISALSGTGAPSVGLLMELGENDALYGLSLDDAELFAGWILDAVAAMREGGVTDGGTRVERGDGGKERGDHGRRRDAAAK